MGKALGVPKMRVIETGGDSFEAEREQWDDGNNVVALEPGVVVAYERNDGHQHRAAQGGHRGHHDRGVRARQGPGRIALHDLSDRARRRVLRRGAAMSFNLRNRSFLKEIDFEPRELRFLLQLSEALKIAEVLGHRGRRGSPARRSR